MTFTFRYIYNVPKSYKNVRLGTSQVCILCSLLSRKTHIYQEKIYLHSQIKICSCKTFRLFILFLFLLCFMLYFYLHLGTYILYLND
nr:MAG TPA: hypothetical protein [Caudoviricetes sp.]